MWSMSTADDCIRCTIWEERRADPSDTRRSGYQGTCSHHEVHGDIDKAEALATCRAIMAALEANETKGGDG